MGKQVPREPIGELEGLDPEDIARARAQAGHRGLRYQTYLKMLIHQALGEGGEC